MMPITDIFPNLHLPYLDIKGIKLDSRDVNHGDLFVAIKGHQSDGRDFIDIAISNGAVAILTETERLQDHLHVKKNGEIPIIGFYDLHTQLSAIAGRFYTYPSQKLDLIGITGTNGKTTISHLLAQWVNMIGHKTAVMGTNGNGLWNAIKPALNTTGSAVAIQSSLAEFVTKGVKLAVIEVSSHGLVQHRIDGLDFSAAIFTNLSHDHLDYHGTMENYLQAKKRLFNRLNVGKRIINIDSDVGKNWATEMCETVAVSLYPLENTDSTQYVYATNVIYQHSGTTIKFDSSWGNGQLATPLIGEFNASNLLLALAALLALDYPLAQLLSVNSQLKSASGRMEMFTKPAKTTVIVDYAHTPDALEKAIHAARLHCNGKLWVLFGCGGDRDKTKRPLMGAIAEKYADIVVLTDDNPRTEKSESILADILAGMVVPTSIIVKQNRKQALSYVLSNAQQDDVVLVAGKGHEDYQIIGNQKTQFSDREIIKQWFNGNNN